MEAFERDEATLRVGGSALCVSVGECDVSLLVKEKMDEAVVVLRKESKGTCMS